jgi:hypothetical protein
VILEDVFAAVRQKPTLDASLLPRQSRQQNYILDMDKMGLTSAKLELASMRRSCFFEFFFSYNKEFLQSAAGLFIKLCQNHINLLSRLFFRHANLPCSTTSEIIFTILDKEHLVCVHTYFTLQVVDVLKFCIAFSGQFLWQVSANNVIRLATNPRNCISS